MIGTVHVVRPRRGEIPASVSREAEVCQAARIVLDLTDASPLVEDDIEVLIDLCQSASPERMQIILPPDVDDRFAARLERISYTVTRLSD